MTASAFPDTATVPDDNAIEQLVNEVLARGEKSSIRMLLDAVSPQEWEDRERLRDLFRAVITYAPADARRALSRVAKGIVGPSEMERWNELGAKLRARDPGRYRKLLELGAAYMAVYEEPGEHEDLFLARMASIAGAGGAA